jgi:hypothetical protein
LALRLARTAEKHPDLAELIDRWPKLSAEIRAAILRIAGA